MLTGTAQPPAMVNGAFPANTGGAFSGFASGTAAAPGAYFIAETNTGFYLAAAGQVGFSSAGTLSVLFRAAGTISGGGVFRPTISLLSSGELNLAAGSGSNQSVTVTPSGSGGFVVNSGTVTSVSGPFRAADGSAAVPSYAFTNEPDCGVFRVGVNNIGLSANGVQIGGFDASGIYAGNAATGTAALNTAVGSAASPSFGFRGDNSGMYRVGSNQLGFSTNSTLRFNITTSALICSLPVRLANAYVAVAPGAATGTVTIQDSTGTTYRIPVLV